MLQQKKINIKNFRSGHKKVDIILSSIRNKSVLEAKIILNFSRKKYANDLYKIIKSQDNEFIISNCYSGIGIKKRKIINMSHGSRVMQKSRRSHLFLTLTKYDKEN